MKKGRAIQANGLDGESIDLKVSKGGREEWRQEGGYKRSLLSSWSCAFVIEMSFETELFGEKDLFL